MKPDDFNDPGNEAADRRDNRIAIVVAVSAAVVVGIASAILMATAGQSPSNATPKPDHSLVQVQPGNLDGIAEQPPGAILSR